MHPKKLESKQSTPIQLNMVMGSFVQAFLWTLSRESRNQREKKEFLRIEKPTNKIKKKIVLEKIKEVTKILNRFLHVIGLKINKEILSLLTYAYPLKALFFYFLFFFSSGSKSKSWMCMG